MADVTIVGAGIAGLSAALRLLERGFSVEVLEQDDFVGGKWGAHKEPGTNDYHEHCYHMLCNWYHNLWSIIDELGLRDNFEPVHHLNYLRPGEYPKATQLRDVGAAETAIPNLFSGVMSVPDTFLYGYSLIDLLGQSFVRTNFLDRYSVNGFMHSRAYTTAEAARHHHRTLAKAFAAPSYATSAATYRNFIGYGVRQPSPMMWMLRDNSHTAFFKPLLDKLHKFGDDRFSISYLRQVKKLRLENGRVTGLEVAKVDRSPSVTALGEAKVISVKDQPVGDHVILTLPPGALARLIDPELFAAAPELAGVKKLRSEPMASIDLHFTRKIPGMPKGIVVLMNAAYDLTFVDNAQQWPGQETTYLNIIVSDFDELAGLPGIGEAPAPSVAPSAQPGQGAKRPSRTVDIENPRAILDYVLRELRRYVPFDPATDIDLERTYLQTNIGEKLMVNDVGSWEYRPTTRCRIPNLFLAGDYCQSPVDAATLEGATMTGLMAAEAVRSADGRGTPIPIDMPKAYPKAAMAAAAWAGAPYAYAAKAVAMAGQEAWLAYSEFMGED